MEADYEQEQYGCGACAGATKKKFAGRRSAGVSSTASLDRMVDKYAILRDTLARKHIRDPTKDSSTVTKKKYGRRTAKKRTVAAKRRRTTTTRARKTPARRSSGGPVYSRYW
jgi:hypothetical protein